MLIPKRKEKIRFVEPLKPSKTEIIKKFSWKIFETIKENPAKSLFVAILIFSVLNLFPHHNRKENKPISTNNPITFANNNSQLKPEINKKVLTIREIHRKDINDYVFTLFNYYPKPDQVIPTKDLQEISNLFFQNFATEYWFSDKRTKSIVTKWIYNYKKYKKQREKIFVKELWPIIWKKQAKKLVLIWFVESYFGAQNNNKIAKWPFQLTYFTAKKYWLIKNWKDYRNYPILSAQAAAKHLKNIFLRWEKLHWKITQDTIWLALADYNGWIINHLKKYPKTIEEYTTTLKNIYLDYNWIITQYSKWKLNYQNFLKKKKQIDKKYFKWNYSLLTLNFKKWTKKAKQINYWKNRLKLVIIQQFKYPWKLEGAWKFIHNYNKKFVLKPKS